MLKHTSDPTPRFVETFIFDESGAMKDATGKDSDAGNDTSFDGMPAVAAQIIGALQLGKPSRIYDDEDGRVIRLPVSHTVFAKSIVVNVLYQVKEREVDEDTEESSEANEENETKKAPTDLRKVCTKDATALFKLLRQTFDESELPGNRVLLPPKKEDDKKQSGNQQQGNRNRK